VALAVRLALAIGIAWPLLACQRESPQITRDRTMEALLTSQIADLKTLVTKAEAGDVKTRDRIAIGLSEETSKAILDASLPQEQTLGGRVLVRVERARPFFQGNSALMAFEAVAKGLKSGVKARLELGGRLVNFRLDQDRLKADVELVHFTVLDSSLAELGNGVLEALVRDNLQLLAKLTPQLELPIKLEHAVAIDGLDDGVVRARPGVLPLAMSVADVIPARQRLWVFLEVKAGPWQPGKAGKDDAGKDDKADKAGKPAEKSGKPADKSGKPADKSGKVAQP